MVAKRKLKDPNSPVVKRPASEIALQGKIIELDDYRRAHALAVRAQIEDEQATSSMLKRDPGLAVEKRKLDFKIQRAIAETELLCSPSPRRTRQDARGKDGLGIGATGSRPSGDCSSCR